VDTHGDSFFAAFPTAEQALAAAAQAQRSLAAQQWPDGMPVLVRMGLHTGEAAVAGDGYLGLAVHRAARITAAAAGGQVLVSEATAALAGDDLPDGTSLRPLGEHPEVTNGTTREMPASRRARTPAVSRGMRSTGTGPAIPAR
jgi:class 3 adenylate cyclase